MLEHVRGRLGHAVRALGRPAKANISVEFALITALFTLPLLLGAADFVTLIAAQAQLNTALQALYFYGETNPADAAALGSDTTDLGYIIHTINANSDFQISLSTTAPPVLTYACYQTPTAPGTVATPSAPNASASANNCSKSGYTVLTYANYALKARVPLIVPLPGLGNPFTESASGYVQISAKNNS